MDKEKSTTKEWLLKEDKINFKDRLTRLDWLINKAPDSEYLQFHGGQITYYLFEEAKYCFVYGQYIASIVLGLSYIEHMLTAIFYGAGRDDLERANISNLLKEALNNKLINQAEFDDLQSLRKKRNPIMHFRKPSHKDTVEYKAMKENKHPYTLIEDDAKFVMKIVMRIADKYSV